MNFMTSDEMNALCSGRFQGDPFSVLGMHLCSKNILTPFDKKSISLSILAVCIKTEKKNCAV